MAVGSPPQMRGKEHTLKSVFESMRITPADAGKSNIQNGGGNSGRDHPRRCGEKWQSIGGKNKHRGSPPQMRGKGRGLVHTLYKSGITPADAGKSFLILVVIIIS